MVSNPLSAEKREKRTLYKTANKVMKKAVKAQKQKTFECKIKQLELNKNSHNLFQTVREFERKPRKPMSAVKDKQGNIHTVKIKALKCWEEHFSAYLNTTVPHQPTAIDEISGPRGSRRPSAQFPRGYCIACQENEEPEGPRYR